MFEFFSGTVTENGQERTIAATSADDVRVIMKKALELEFIGEFPIFHVLEPKKLPDSYIVFEVAYSRFVLYADDKPQMKKTNFDVTFVTKDLNLKAKIPDRIAKSLVDKGFSCVELGRDLQGDELTEYFATQLEFSWVGVF